MKIAILGGGFAGLSAAHYLRKKQHDIVLFERESVLGGLAAGFKPPHWDWPLERAYHHLFSNDSDIANFAKETGFSDIYFQSPETASLYEVDGNYRTIPLDTPQDLLKFPLLSFPEKIRAGVVLAFFKFSPFLPIYEKMTAYDFLNRTMGSHAREVLFGELTRKKFGKYAGNILAAFFWARITKRTKSLGYIKGGFQSFLDHLETVLKDEGIDLRKGVGVEKMEKRGDKFLINGEVYDAVVSTLPTPVLTKLGVNVLPANYLKKISKVKFLHAMTLIIETKEKLLDKAYWLNICTDKMPMMVAVQHTNLVGKEYYGGNNLIYIGNYIDADHKLLKMDKEETLKYMLPHLKKINPAYGKKILNAYHFKAPFAQPIFDREFVEVKPDFVTPTKNFFIANLDMTYPYDRGTNYAVKLGKDVSELI